jgi:hypothetical protein
MEILGTALEEILNEEDPNFIVIDKYYEFIGCDHDLWEFTAIVKNILHNQYFKVNWYDNYSCNWNELGLTEDWFELTEVFPKLAQTFVYE